MPPLSYSGYRFPRDIIQRAVWMYLRFTLSFRDVEELLAERGIVVSHETVRRWVLTFGPAIARRLRARRPKPHSRWHLDEMFVRVGGKQMYLWRAVDAEGEVLDVLLQAKRDTKAARWHCHGNGAEAQNGSGQLALTPQRSRAATLASPLTGRSEACGGRRGGVEG
jgi:putative transposase